MTLTKEALQAIEHNAKQYAPDDLGRQGQYILGTLYAIIAREEKAAKRANKSPLR